MSKKYVLFGAVQGIGGWQLYCEARAKHIAETGASVYIVYSSLLSNPIQLKGFLRSTIVNIPEMDYLPYALPKQETRRLINELVKLIEYQEDDDVFVESTSIVASFWGELLAAATGGMNYIYILQSHNEDVGVEKVPFLYQHYCDGMLAGILKKTLPELFGGYYEIEASKETTITASWENPIDFVNDYCETFNFLNDLIGARKVIGYFGTLNKPHFEELCRDLQRYFIRRADSSFAFISIGSSSDGVAENEQMKVFDFCQNCVSINIGALYPAPQSFFSLMDVCIGSFGSSVNAARAGAVTLRLADDIGVVPQGIIGVTLKEFPYHEVPNDITSLEDYLDNILFRGIYDDADYEPPIPYEDCEKRQMLEDSIIQPFIPRNNPTSYYPVMSIPRSSWKQQVRWLAAKTLGVPAMLKIDALRLNRRRQFTQKIRGALRHTTNSMVITINNAGPNKEVKITIGLKTDG